MQRQLAPFAFLLLGAVAPAASDSTLHPASAVVADADGPLHVYRSRQGDTLRGIASAWLLPTADLRRLQALNDLSASTRIPQGTDIRIPEKWLKTLAVEATVAAFRGEVRVVRGRTSLAVAKGMRLLEGDEIETGPNGFATLALPDASRVSLPSASRVAIERLRQILLTDSLDRRFTLLDGRSDMQVTPMANPASRFLITTPVAVAAVRGTEYRVRFTPAEMRAVTEVTEGRVAVQLLDGSAEILVEAGFAAVATPEGLRGPLALPGRPLVAVRSRAQTGREVVFRLRPTPGIVSYLVELAADAGFSDRVASAETASGEVVFRNLPDGHYHARAYLVSAEGVRGLPASFEFDRAYRSAGAAPADVDDGAVRRIALPAALPFAAGFWVSGVGGGGSGDNGASAGPVVATANVARLAETTAAPLAALARLQPFVAGGPGAQGFVGGFPGGGFPGGGFPGGAGGGAFPDAPSPPDSGQTGGPSIPDAGVPTPVPEPAAWLLLLTGFGLAGWMMRSRRSLA